MQVIVLDADVERGRRIAASLTDCGFLAESFALDDRGSLAGRRTSIIAVERSSVGVAGDDEPSAPLVDPKRIAGLREACGARLVIAWIAGPGGPDDARCEGSPWADDEVSGLNGLVGRISLAATSSGGAPFGDLAQMRVSIEAARDAAHELSQPLTTIVARSRLLLESMSESEPGYRPVSIISQEADRLARTVEIIKRALPPRRKA